MLRRFRKKRSAELEIKQYKSMRLARRGEIIQVKTMASSAVLLGREVEAGQENKLQSLTSKWGLN